MHKVWANRNGFTIVELLVTIAVIGILASIMIISYSGIQQRSRDSTRDSDVTQLKIAIEKYHSEKSKYPDVCPGGDNSDCDVSYLSATLNPYLKTVPIDPSNASDSSIYYSYVKGPSSSDSYGLRVHYEAKPVCQTGENMSSSWWDGSVPNCK